MAKLTLSDVLSSYASTTKVNANSALVEAALENTLSRDGTSPNHMLANLDMNDYRIINLGDPSAADEAVNKNYVDNQLATLTGLDTFLTNPSGAGVVYVSPEGVSIGPKVIYVDLYDGIDSTGVTDSSAGLKALITANGKTNVEYVFNPAGTYLIHSTEDIYTAVGPILTGVATNLYLNFNGCRFNIDRPFTNGSSSFIWQFADGSQGIRIGRHKVYQDKEWSFADLFNAGTWWLYFADAITDVYIEEAYGENLRLFLDITRGTDATKRVRNVYCEGITTVHTAYPFSLRNNGDDVHVRYLHSFEAGRPAICYGWHGLLKIDELIEQDSATQIKLMNPTTGADLYANNDGTTGAAIINHIGLAPTGQADFGEAYRMSIEQRGTDPGIFGPLYIKSDVTLDATGPNTQGFLNLIKSITGSVADTTAGRGHKIALILDAAVHEAPPTEVVALFPTSGGDWAGEDVNLVVNRLIVRGDASSSIEIDYDGMAQGPLLNYVDLIGTATETGTPSATAAKVIWKTSAGNNGNLVTEGRANIFSENQAITKAAAALRMNNTSGTASTLKMSADDGLVYVGSETATTVRWIQSNTTRGGVLSVGPYSETGWLLRDGIAEPTTNATYATIYIDTADGDLKIKFGDGTVKTIVVDT